MSLPPIEHIFSASRPGDLCLPFARALLQMDHTSGVRQRFSGVDQRLNLVFQITAPIKVMFQ
jgi:hypothetical protein